MIGLKRSILQRVEFCKSENNIVGDIGKSSSLNLEPLTTRKITDFSIRKILSDDSPCVHVSKSSQFNTSDQCTLFNSINYVSENITENCEFAKCLQCDKMFQSIETLKIHNRTHNTRRYECKECGKGFSQVNVNLFFMHPIPCNILHLHCLYSLFSHN